MKKIQITALLILCITALFSQNYSGLKIELLTKPDTNKYNVFGMLCTNIHIINHDSVERNVASLAPRKTIIRLSEDETDIYKIRDGSQYTFPEAYETTFPIQSGDTMKIVSYLNGLDFLYQKYKKDPSVLNSTLICKFKVGIYCEMNDSLSLFIFSDEYTVEFSPLNAEDKNTFIHLVDKNIDPDKYTNINWIKDFYSKDSYVESIPFVLTNYPQSSFAQCAKLCMAYRKYNKNLTVQDKVEIELLLSDGMQSEYSFIKYNAEQLFQKINAN